LNASLLDKIYGVISGAVPVAASLVISTLITEAILLVAAQTGFIDGPRVLSNMALTLGTTPRFSLERSVGYPDGFGSWADLVSFLLYTQAGEPPGGDV
jgi:hypothetical protein